MILLAGLGNPGKKYTGNRHNIGFMAVDEIARANGFSSWRARFQSETAEGHLGSEKVLLMKPQTFMNESGRAIAEAVKFYKIDLSDVIVFHDELDLAAGKLRCKRGGGLAGHNGLRSINAHLGPEFNRVRMGIDHPGNKSQVHSWVLKDFSKEDHKWLSPMIDTVGRHADLLAQGDTATFQNKVHLAVSPQTGPVKASPAKKLDKPVKSKVVKPLTETKSESEKSGPFADALKKLFTSKDKS